VTRRVLAHGAALLGVLALVIGVQAAAARAEAPEWGWPLAGEPAVDRPFQPPTTAWGAGHRGVDLRGELGEPVLAAGAGRVTYAGRLAGRGVVTVTHANGLRTTYEPVAASVGVGRWVDTGDVLGTLGTGHGSCRPGTVCLHWGLLRGKTYLDPLGLVVGGRLQLLPINAKAPHDLDDKDKDDKDKRQKAKKRFDRLRAKAADAAKKTARGVSKVAKRSARVVERAVVKAAPKAARVVARQAARSAAAAAAAAAAPEVIAVVVVVVVVGGTVYYVRRRE
jgi:hypothetical protein